MNTNSPFTRRRALKTLGAAGVLVAPLGANVRTGHGAEAPSSTPGSAREDIWKRVHETPLIDTHEHLIEEKERLSGAASWRTPCDDWAFLFSHYLNSDLLSAGMPPADMAQFLSRDVDPLAKWKLLAPFWPAVKNTGYAHAVRIAVRELYEVEDISAQTVAKVQSGYERTRKAGFYQRILQEQARIESCQVNTLTGKAFEESHQPALLMQDLSIVGMFDGPSFREYGRPTGIQVNGLGDWYRVMEWWFEKYARYAVAVKSQHAYSRDIDYARVPAEKTEPIFHKILQKDPVSVEERKLVEDHLFWHAVDLATRHDLPVKLHTGYYAGQNSMPLSRLIKNAGSAAELCRQAPETRFVFMHICYPFYEELLSVAKHWTNASIDLCWAWIINPVAAKDYLKKHIVTAPINKLLPFGGDYIPVEPVLGHAAIARRGIAQALTELVEEQWLNLRDAVELIEPILNGNARRLFRLDQKKAALERAPWV